MALHPGIPLCHCEPGGPNIKSLLPVPARQSTLLGRTALAKPQTDGSCRRDRNKVHISRQVPRQMAERAVAQLGCLFLSAYPRRGGRRRGGRKKGKTNEEKKRKKKMLYYFHCTGCERERNISFSMRRSGTRLKMERSRESVIFGSVRSYTKKCIHVSAFMV